MNNYEIAKRAADLLDSRDLNGLQDLLADDFKAQGATRELTKQQTLAYLQLFFIAFPDHRFGFTNFEDKGDLLSCVGEETGTHKGMLDLKPFGMPVSLSPTGKHFKLPRTIFTFHVAGDKLISFSEESVKGVGWQE